MAYIRRFAVPAWLIPMLYTVMSIIAGFVLPRIEQGHFPRYTHTMSVSSALAFFSSIGSGMMALTGIVFAIAFVVVQFSSLAYSPRLVIMFANSRTQYHALGIFFATFIYSLVALYWTDRGGSGTVPYFSTMLVMVLLTVSMVAFARLIQSLNHLEIHNVLRVIGGKGREVIGDMFPLKMASGNAQAGETIAALTHGPLTQTVTYSGEPRVIARFDLGVLVRLAQSTEAVIAIQCGVGETLVEDAVLFHVYGAKQQLPRETLMRAVRRATSRTFEQDPKYAIRLLVDIAIRALSPAIYDPTTAVQALDQIEDLLRRLGCRQLDAGCAWDSAGVVRVTFPVSTWQDYLALSFDEIRQFGGSSVQVLRRLRAALVGLENTIPVPQRRDAVSRYLDHLNLGIGSSHFDDQDKAVAFEEDRQGLGLSRKRPARALAAAAEAQDPVAAES